MSSNLYAASLQWSTRPDDERWESLEEMLSACRAHRDSAREAVVPINTLRACVGGDGAELELVGKKGTPARLTHWAFGQLSQKAGAPAEYLRRLPAKLAAENVNHGLSKLSDDKANLLIHRNGSLVLRSITSDSYTRIWNCDAIERLRGFAEYGWRVPPARPARPDQKGTRPATEQDVLECRDGAGGLSINVGDLIAPAGLYASDHDMFVFMVNEKNRIADGTEGGLSRGFFLTNSEVGAAALKVTTFLYRHVCGNHICWNVSGVREIKIVHRGQANARFRHSFVAELKRYSEAGSQGEELKIAEARKFKLGNTKEEVLETVFKHLRGDASYKTLEAGYDRAAMDSNSDRTLDPNTAWGMSNGLTAHSQTTPYADERVRIDRAGAKVLQMAF